MRSPSFILSAASSASSAPSLPIIAINDLRCKSISASAAVRDAFTGRSSLGALCVRVPGFDEVRRNALRSGAWLALDPSATAARDSCRHSNENRRVVPGWSGHPGVEGHPIQSGFYCNLREELGGSAPGSSATATADDIFGENLWPPDHVLNGDGDSFRANVVEAGRTMLEATSLALETARKVGVEEARKRGGTKQLTELTTLSDTFLPLRLAYYDAAHSREDNIVGGKFWLPWHVDFNLATAFISASWIDEGQALAGDGVHIFEPGGNSNPEQYAGLLLRNAQGDVVPASIPEDCVLVQLGAYAQIASGGLLRAGPHAVGRRRNDDDTAKIDDTTATDAASLGRLTLGLFVYAPWEAKMLSPNTEDDSAVLEDDFGGLMKKAYTGETVLAGFQKFADYMNAPRD